MHAVLFFLAISCKLQQPDGLCWAKADYHAKYLEDNSEIFSGLRDLADLERDVFDDSQQVAEQVRHGIVSELYDRQANLFLIAKFEDGRRAPANLDILQNKSYGTQLASLPGFNLNFRGASG